MPWVRPSVLGVVAAAVAILPAGAFADVNLEVANGDTVTGTLSPGGEVEDFRFRAPQGALLSVSLKGKKAKGGAAAPVVGFDLLDPDGQEVAEARPASGPAKLKKLPLPETGEWTVRVTGDGIVGDYVLSIAWKSPTRFPVAGDLGSGGATFAFSADRFAVATFSVAAKERGTAPVLVGVERGEPTLKVPFGPPAPGASKHVVKGVTLGDGGDFALSVSGTGGRYAGTVQLKLPRPSRRNLRITTAVLGDDLDDNFAAGAVVGAEGGVVAAGDFGTSPVDGAAVDIPPGALQLPTAIVIGTGAPIGSQDGVEGAGPTVSFSPDGQKFGEAVTATVPFDPEVFGGDFSELRIYTKGKDGKVTLVDPATYSIDPVAATVSFPTTHFSSYRAFGPRARKRGDLDGDGFADLVVGAPGANGGAGRVLIFRGSANFAPGKASDANLILTPAAGDGGFGIFVATGDVNGDGFADVAVTASGNSPGVRVFFGRSDFFGNPASGPNVTVTPGTSDSLPGSAMAIADATGDGIADLVLGDPFSSYNSNGAGAVHVVRGGAALATVATDDRSVLHFWGESTADEFGASVAVGDVNGDGVPDVIVGAPQVARGNTGLVYVIPAGPNAKDGGAATLGTVFTGEELGDAFGAAVAAADLNEDGIADLVVGAPFADPIGGPQQTPVADAGAVYTFFGKSGLRGIGAGSADIRFTAFEEAGAQRGRALAVGNVIGNSTRDLLVGTPGSSIGAAFAGGAFLARGAPGFGFNYEQVQGSLQDENLGDALLPPVDLDGDGRDESILVAPMANGGDGRLEIRFGPGLFSRTISVTGGTQDNFAGRGL